MAFNNKYNQVPTPSLFNQDGLSLIWWFLLERNVPLTSRVLCFAPTLGDLLHTWFLTRTFGSFSVSRSSSHFPVHWVKYGGANQALTCLLLLSTDFFKYPLACSLHHYISPPLPRLQPHSIPCFLLVSRLFDFVKYRFFSLFFPPSTDAPLSFYSDAFRGSSWLINLLSDSKIYVCMCLCKQCSPFINLGCV